MVEALPLAGSRVGVTAARKVEEQVSLLERRGAEVVVGPALSSGAHRVDEAALRADTEAVLARPVDLFLATTGIGLRTWFDAAEEWGRLEALLGHLGGAEVLARGPKSVGALRRRGLQERWAPASEAFEDVLAHLRGRDLTGLRVVVQEHGQALTAESDELRARGADVTAVAVYRTVPAEDPAPLLRLVDEVAARRVDAVTFTSAPAAVVLLDAAADVGLRDEVLAALREHVLAVCVGPVTAAALVPWDVPTTCPTRSRLTAMVRHLESELLARRGPGSGRAG